MMASSLLCARRLQRITSLEQWRMMVILVQGRDVIFLELTLIFLLYQRKINLICCLVLSRELTWSLLLSSEMLMVFNKSKTSWE